jgi:hypothetical protein
MDVHNCTGGLPAGPHPVYEPKALVLYARRNVTPTTCPCARLLTTSVEAGPIPCDQNDVRTARPTGISRRAGRSSSRRTGIWATHRIEIAGIVGHPEGACVTPCGRVVGQFNEDIELRQVLKDYQSAKPRHATDRPCASAAKSRASTEFRTNTFQPATSSARTSPYGCPCVASLA